MVDQIDIKIADLMNVLGKQARNASNDLCRSSEAQRYDGLNAAADQIIKAQDEILCANLEDMKAAEKRNLTGSMLDRLFLDLSRIEAIAEGIRNVAELPDTLGSVSDEWLRPNGLVIQRVSVPLGVIGIIYESRPNVTADAGALCIKSGNAVILRGGSESFNSSLSIHGCMVRGLVSADLPEHAVQMVSTTDRDAVGFMLSSMQQFVDVVVPRGGRSLIERVLSDARIPVIGHLEGLCHVYVHASAKPEMARDIVINAKMRRTGICGAAETLLIDNDCIDTHWQIIADALIDNGCEIRADETICSLDSRANLADDLDWDTEYLDAIISVRTVNSVDEAISHISKHGSGHTEAIVAEDNEIVDQFFHDLDSAILLHNASTQYADGGEFGMGAEIGISTGKIHARGPVGAEQLTSYKYIVRGKGQTRP
ncbi:MAG: glutamate-5-semialdehyde dehydrogenase [Pseudomonadota bacterium]|nr:glutamate-5-semialdehyde dehydrogenase [Pseudomonadota bacterium]